MRYFNVLTTLKKMRKNDKRSFSGLTIERKNVTGRTKFEVSTSTHTMHFSSPEAASKWITEFVNS